MRIGIDSTMFECGYVFFLTPGLAVSHRFLPVPIENRSSRSLSSEKWVPFSYFSPHYMSQSARRAEKARRRAERKELRRQQRELDRVKGPVLERDSIKARYWQRYLDLIGHLAKALKPVARTNHYTANIVGFDESAFHAISADFDIISLKHLNKRLDSRQPLTVKSAGSYSLH